MVHLWRNENPAFQRINFVVKINMGNDFQRVNFPFAKRNQLTSFSLIFLYSMTGEFILLTLFSKVKTKINAGFISTRIHLKSHDFPTDFHPFGDRRDGKTNQLTESDLNRNNYFTNQLTFKEFLLILFSSTMKIQFCYKFSFFWASDSQMVLIKNFVCVVCLKVVI